jgi:hypothetical protein
MASKIGKKEWWGIFIVMGIIDFVQFVIIELILVWFFGVGALINEILDPIVGIVFAGYLYLRGVSVGKYWKSYASIVGMEALEELTGGIAQLWILDVWYIRGNIRQIEGTVEEQKMLEQQNSVRQPLYVNGVRRPETQTANSYSEDVSNTRTSGEGFRTSSFNVRPLNFNGVRVAVNNQPGTRTGTSGSNKANPASMNVKANTQKQIDTNETLAA